MTKINDHTVPLLTLLMPYLKMALWVAVVIAFPQVRDLGSALVGIGIWMFPFFPQTLNEVGPVIQLWASYLIALVVSLCATRFAVMEMRSVLRGRTHPGTANPHGTSQETHNQAKL